MECKTSGITPCIVSVLRSVLSNWVQEELFSNNPTQIAFNSLLIKKVAKKPSKLCFVAESGVLTSKVA